MCEWTSSNAGQTGRVFLRCGALMSRESISSKFSQQLFSSVLNLWNEWFFESFVVKCLRNIPTMKWLVSEHFPVQYFFDVSRVDGLPSFTCGWARQIFLIRSDFRVFFKRSVSKFVLKHFKIIPNNLLQEKIYIPNYPQIFSLLFKDEVFPNDLWRQIPNRLQVGDLDWMNLVKPIIFKTWSICIFYMNARLFMMNLILISPFLTWFWTWTW